MDGAIIVRRHGGPEVLEWSRQDPGHPGEGEVLVRHTAVGLNFIDVYHRTGLYMLDLPFIPGSEGAGVVEEVGPGVVGLAVGDRVAYTSNGPEGAYREGRVLPAARLVKLPDEISDEVAAAIMVKGCTVEYLVRRTWPLAKGDVVLLHAAAGGVGLLAAQWLAALGVKVIGTVGSEAKAELAKRNGCAHTIQYRKESVPERVRELTGGRGVDVVLDSVGRDTWDGSLDALRPRGIMVSFGNASGAVPPFSPLLLAKKGSLFLTRPTLRDYYATREDTVDGCAALFGMVASGQVKPHIGARYPLREAADAHIALEARETVGSTVLIV